MDVYYMYIYIYIKCIQYESKCIDIIFYLDIIQIIEIKQN